MQLVPSIACALAFSVVAAERDPCAARRDYRYPHLFRLIIGNDILQNWRFAYGDASGWLALECTRQT
jgi:hypothetical protein